MKSLAFIHLFASQLASDTKFALQLAYSLHGFGGLPFSANIVLQPEAELRVQRGVLSRRTRSGLYQALHRGYAARPAHRRTDHCGPVQKLTGISRSGNPAARPIQLPRSASDSRTGGLRIPRCHGPRSKRASPSADGGSSVVTILAGTTILIALPLRICPPAPGPGSAGRRCRSESGVPVSAG